MRIDPSQLSEPLAHVLGVNTTDATRGQKTAAAKEALHDPQLEQLDASLVQRLRTGALLDARGAATSVEQARAILAQLAEAMGADPASASAAQSGLDNARVRGLLGG